MVCVSGVYRKVIYCDCLFKNKNNKYDIYNLLER